MKALALFLVLGGASVSFGAPRPPDLGEARVSPEVRVLRDLGPNEFQRTASRLQGVYENRDVKLHLELAPGILAEEFLRQNPELAMKSDVQVVLGNELQLLAGLEQLGWLSGYEEIHRIRRPAFARPKAYVSEGVEELFESEQWSARGITGEGVKVAVIDVGFRGYKEVLGEELPLYTNASGLEGAWEEDNHGTAVAEIIHDVAPGAEIALYSFETELEFRLILRQFAEGELEADVINASVGFDNVWHVDGTSPYSQAVDAVVDAGIFYVAAAGNEAENYRWGTLSDIDGNGYLEIDGEEGIWISAGRFGSSYLAEASLRWSDGMEASGTDLDLLITDETDSVECGRSENPQEGADSPFEYVSCSLDTSWALAWIVDYSSGAARGKTAWIYRYAGVDSSQMVQSGTLTL
ncbi:MAG: S8 family serine peptidase, partial [Myxococcota bacterium]|nr:S8 family serine peptidase [Myxococcota bacterium]